MPDYDHLPVGSVEARVRSLDLKGVRQLLAYETQHANRLPLVQVLEHRVRELEGGAQPTGGSPSSPMPEVSAPTAPEPPARPETTGPPVNPPSQGVPTNPAQPRR